MSLRIAIVGGSGYTGVELLRILKGHPGVTVTCVTSRKLAGTKVASVFPSLHGYGDLLFSDPDPERIVNENDFVFTAVPHQAAMGIVPGFLEHGLKVVDLSADFRLRDARIYETWYQPHSHPELLNQAVYGLPELYRSEIISARLVANPGCYPTSALLPLVPLLKESVIGWEGIVIDSKSGASGAGRSASMATIFCEVNEAFKAYKVGEHRHTPEIEQELSRVSGKDVRISFTPHLVPMTRGILTTIYARLTRKISTADALSVLSRYYNGATFVRVMGEGVFPNVSFVRGGNCCDIAARVDERTGRIVLVSAIDNLIKGASGQAVQNMNLMVGFDEGQGLETAAIFP